MTARELIDFLSKYDDNTSVTMLLDSTENPLKDDIPIKGIVAIKGCIDNLYIFIIPD